MNIYLIISKKQTLLDNELHRENNLDHFEEIHINMCILYKTAKINNKQTRGISAPGKRQNKRILTYAGTLTTMKNNENKSQHFNRLF